MNARSRRLVSLHSTAIKLAAEVQAFAEGETLAEHIRHRGEWSRIEVGANKLLKEIEAMVERIRSEAA